MRPDTDSAGSLKSFRPNSVSADTRASAGPIGGAGSNGRGSSLRSPFAGVAATPRAVTGCEPPATALSAGQSARPADVTAATAHGRRRAAVRRRTAVDVTLPLTVHYP